MDQVIKSIEGKIQHQKDVQHEHYSLCLGIPVPSNQWWNRK